MKRNDLNLPDFQDRVIQGLVFNIVVNVGICIKYCNQP